MKYVINITMVFIIFTLLSCTKRSLTEPNISYKEDKQDSPQNKAAHFIGERFGGGIIFVLNSSRNHGLIADTIDLGLFTWYNGMTTLTGASGKAIGTGQTNTMKIILSQGVSGNYAALECYNSQRNGYSDWFLPSKGELNELYKLKKLVGGFTTGFYWSSSEKSNPYSWEQGFDDGFQNYYYKYLRNYVRAIRSF